MDYQFKVLYSFVNQATVHQNIKVNGERVHLMTQKKYSTTLFSYAPHQTRHTSTYIC